MTLRETIDARIAAGDLVADPSQDEAIAALDAILVHLSRPPVANKGSALGWLFGNKPKAQSPDRPRGLYMFGGVGRGKTMLMDTAFALAEGLPRATPRRRAHFHAFMADVHGRIHRWRQEHENGGDPIPRVAGQIAREAKLLAFDEFAVTDAADAMILARLFTELFQRGVTVIATSNVAPDNLYRNGLNRSFFAPFIEILKTRMTVVHLASHTDHRMSKLADGERYLVRQPDRFDALWHDMTGEAGEEEASLKVAGRELVLKRTCGGQLRTSFDRLCRKPLGASDYLAICARFRAVFLEGVPVLHDADRNAAKRFIALIDTLYDTRRVLIVDADAQPSELLKIGSGTEAFEFARTVSRLQEMQAADWAREDA